MKSFLPLLLLVIVALTLGLAGYFAFSTSASSYLTPIATPVTSTASTPDRQTKTGASTIELGEDLEEPGLTSADPGETARNEVEIDTRPDWTRDGGASASTGKVILPPGTPADEQLLITVAPFLGDEPVDPNESSAKPLDSYEVTVAKDGSFEYIAPRAGTLYSLKLTSRYLIPEGVIKRGPSAVSDQDPVFQTRLGAWISGRITLPEGRAVSAAGWRAGQVRVGIDTDADINQAAALSVAKFERMVTPGVDGHFDFFALPSNKAFGFRAELDDFPANIQSGLSIKPGQHLVLDAPFQTGATLSGVVVDESGAPVAFAGVIVSQGEGIDIFAELNDEWSLSDQDGNFELKGLAPGALRISANMEGFLAPPSELLEVVDGESRGGIRIVFLIGNAVEGVVLGIDGAPFEGAEVRLRFDPAALNGLNARNASKGANGLATSDEDGHFRITGLANGPFQVEAKAEAGEDSDLYAKVSGIGPGTMDVKLELHSLVPMRGIVVDTEGTPIQDYTITVMPGNLGGLTAGDRHNKEISDLEGRFEIKAVTEGSWNIYVKSEGYGAVGPLNADRPGPGGEEYRIVMHKGATVLGQVVTPNGEPIPDATVTWQQGSRDALLTSLGVGPTVTGNTDDQGNFEITGLPPGDLSLATTSPNWAKAAPLQLELAAGEIREGVLITMRVGGTITGEYFDKQGELAKGVLIQIMRTGGADQNFTSTDAGGQFMVEFLEPGDWQVIGVAGDLEGNQAELLANLKMSMASVKDGETTHVILGAPPENPVHIVGQLNPSEDAAGGIAVFIPEGKGMLGAMKMAPIDASGKFETDLDGPGAYVITIQTVPKNGIGQDNVEFLEHIPVGANHRLDLELPGGGISGRVTDDRGNGLSGVRVSLYTDGGASTGTMSGGKYSEAVTEEDGTYELGHLPPGTYTVGAGGRPLTSVFDSESDFGRVVLERVGVSKGDITSGIDFELETAGSIAGRVLDATGAPLQGASIFVRNEDGALLERISLQASSSDGKFTYGGIAPGKYTISSRVDLLSTPVGTTIEVRSGETSQVELIVDSATMLEVTCVDGENNPIVANIEVRNSDGLDFAGQFGMSDLAKMMGDSFSTTTRMVGPLPPGKYTVTGTVDGLSKSRTVSLTGKDKRKLRLRIK